MVKMTTTTEIATSLTSIQKRLVIERTSTEINRAGLAYKRNFPEYEIRFDLSGLAAGQFSQRNGSYLLRYNEAIFARYFQANLETTVAHEVAHFIVQVLYPKRRIGRSRVLPHGREWCEVMALLGADASVCHKFDLSGLPQRRERRFAYVCDCQQHQLSCRKHNKIQLAKMRYICRRCGSGLREVA